MNTDVVLPGAVAVPPSTVARRRSGSYGICRVCRGPAAAGLSSCWSCRRVRAQLGDLSTPVVPLFLFSLGSAAHRALVDYKAAASPSARLARRRPLEMMLATFFDLHLRCVVDPRSAEAMIVPVPSTIGGRPSWGGRHPVGRLAEVVLGRRDRCGAAGVELRLAEVLRAGAVPPRRLEADAAGFEVKPSCAGGLSGASVVVLDDVFTSGARALSVAAALRRAGADVAAVVPIGRLVRPDHSRATAAFWADWSVSSWEAASCARCRRADAVALGCESGLAGFSARLAA